MTNGKSITFLDGQVRIISTKPLDNIARAIGANNISSLKDASAQPPIGCGFSTLSDKCKLYILLKGIIDVDKEEIKLKKKKASLLQQIESLKKLMNSDNYESKVPEDVRQKNTEKVRILIMLEIIILSI